ncbi:MAG: cyclic nucleotide-binding domain-containing protein [Notoacmeibacter sp.]
MRQAPMALDDEMAVLARVALFTNLGSEQLRLIAFGAEPYELPEGRLLCRSGEIADGGFVLVSGQLARLNDRAQTIERSFTEAGTLIGELSLLTRCAWQSTIIAAKTSRLLRLPRPLFRRILEEYPQTAIDLEKILTADLSNKVRLMEKAAKNLDRK